MILKAIGLIFVVLIVALLNVRCCTEASSLPSQHQQQLRANTGGSVADDFGSSSSHRQLYRSKNSLCTNATIIDPATSKTFVAEPNYPPTYQWYKLTNPLTTPLSVVVTIDKHNQGTFNAEASLILYKASDCGSIKHRHWSDPPSPFGMKSSFVAEGMNTYYLKFTMGPLRYQPFKAVIELRKQFFSVIDSRIDDSVEELGRVLEYYCLPSANSNLNVQANFDLPPESVKSVRMTVDNQRSWCDPTAPYTAFGDSNDDTNSSGVNYDGVAIPLGPHKITATPFAQPNCTGTKGVTMEKRFNVTGCYTIFYVCVDNIAGYCVDRFEMTPIVSPFLSGELSRQYGYNREQKQVSLPRRTEITSAFVCGFIIHTVHLALRDGRTNTLVHENTLVTAGADYMVHVSNFYLFNTSRPDRGTGRIRPGFYTLQTTINNITQPLVNLTVLPE